MKFSSVNYSGVIAFILGVSIPLLSYTCGNGKPMVSAEQGNVVSLDTTDCYSDRKSMNLVSIQNANIRIISDTYIITDKSGNSRYIACNLPVAFQTEDLQFSCTLMVKEIFPNERRFATPALLKDISMQE